MKTLLPPAVDAAEITEARIAPHGALATATLTPAGDGIAYASRLLHRALSDLGGQAPTVIELGVTGAEPVAFRTRMQFLARLARLQTLRRVNWLLFTHIGIARAQLRVPRNFRRPYAVMLHGIESWSSTLDAERLAVIGMQRSELRSRRTRPVVLPRRTPACRQSRPACSDFCLTRSTLIASRPTFASTTARTPWSSSGEWRRASDTRATTSSFSPGHGFWPRFPTPRS